MKYLTTASIIALSTLGVTAPASAALKAYTTTLLQLDDNNARSKKIRVIYSLDNVWNKHLLPDGAKEARFTLNGGGGFDMTGVPNKAHISQHGPVAANYRYTIPTAFELGIQYKNGAPLRHMNHVPQNTIGSASVSQSLDFNLGLSGTNGAPTVSAGITWSKRVTYQQKEFETVADFNPSTGESTRWRITNKTVRHHKPVKKWLVYGWLNCTGVNNLINVNELPVVMRSDFRPQVAALYRKKNINDGQNSTKVHLWAGWQKTDYYFASDWCSWYDNFTWAKNGHRPKDTSTWTWASREINVSWNDSLYR